MREDERGKNELSRDRDNYKVMYSSSKDIEEHTENQRINATARDFFSLLNHVLECCIIWLLTRFE